MKNCYKGAGQAKTTLTFNFDEEAVNRAGLTKDELLEDMRCYAKECDVEEIAYGVFEKRGEDSMAILIGYAVRKVEANPEYLNYLTSWIADVNGNIEDCKAELEELINEDN